MHARLRCRKVSHTMTRLIERQQRSVLLARAIAEMLNELAAIWIWDKDYRRISAHDEIDQIAWEARRKREAEIMRIIFTLLPATQNLLIS